MEGLNNGRKFLLSMRAWILRLRARLSQRINKKPKHRKETKKVKVKPTIIPVPNTDKKSQSQAFIEARNPKIQYAIDVLALAFILAVILTIIERHYR